MVIKWILEINIFRPLSRFFTAGIFRKMIEVGSINEVHTKIIIVSKWMLYPFAIIFKMHSIENHNFPTWLTVFDADIDSEKNAGIDIL